MGALSLAYLRYYINRLTDFDAVHHAVQKFCRFFYDSLYLKNNSSILLQPIVIKQNYYPPYGNTLCKKQQKYSNMFHTGAMH